MSAVALYSRITGEQNHCLLTCLGENPRNKKRSAQQWWYTDHTLLEKEESQA